MVADVNWLLGSLKIFQSMKFWSMLACHHWLKCFELCLVQHLHNISGIIPRWEMYFSRITWSENDKIIKHFGKIYCLLVWYLIIFDSFGASQAVFRSLCYIKPPLWKEICLFLGYFVISAQAAKKLTSWLPNINEYLTSREYFNIAKLYRMFQSYQTLMISEWSGGVWY